jgi:hypothetical protein
VQVAPPLRFSFGEFLPELATEPSQSPYTGSERNRRVRLSPERLALNQYNPSIDVGQAFPFLRPSGPPESTSGLARQVVPDQPTSSSANRHINESSGALGRFSGFDYALLSAGADAGEFALGGRLRGFHTRGPLYFEVAASPLRLFESNSGRRRQRDLSAITSASATYRSDAFDVQIGRQRFVSGPTQATIFGSLLRGGGREVLDAIRLQPHLPRGQSLEVAYLHDAFVRNLPYNAGGAQRGAYGRAAMETKYVNLGVNALRYFNLPGDTLGASVDWAVPLLRDEIEFYGEAGRDPFRRRLTTFGLSFPGLHDRTNLDLFVETNRLRGTGSIPSPPGEVTLRAYRRINRFAYLTMGASRFSDKTSALSLGLAIGDRSYRGREP